MLKNTDERRRTWNEALGKMRIDLISGSREQDDFTVDSVLSDITRE